jgi:hypothetical protein
LEKVGIMLETYGNLWELADQGCDALVITTNGYVRKDGRAVMGRGIAKEAADRFLELPGQLGTALRKEGNHCFVFAYQPYDIVAFPVKPIFGPNGEPGWRARAEIPLIETSARELVKLADRYDWTDVLMPRPGCGFGSLKWAQVKPVISPILDDRFTAVTFGNL